MNCELLISEAPAHFGAVASGAELLSGLAESRAIGLVKANHYLKSVPSGKTHWVRFGSAIIAWSIPANSNIDVFLLGRKGVVWELSRLWAPDHHENNLLTRAISAAVELLKRIESPEAVVSYADPAAKHHGGVYRAASWIYDGKVEDTRTYLDREGKRMTRRAFHSGRHHMTKAQIEASGFREIAAIPKVRFVKPLTRKARRDYESSRINRKGTKASRYRFTKGEV